LATVLRVARVVRANAVVVAQCVGRFVRDGIVFFVASVDGAIDAVVLLRGFSGDTVPDVDVTRLLPIAKLAVVARTIVRDVGNCIRLLVTFVDGALDAVTNLRRRAFQAVAGAVVAGFHAVAVQTVVAHLRRTGADLVSADVVVGAQVVVVAGLAVGAEHAQAILAAQVVSALVGILAIAAAALLILSHRPAVFSRTQRVAISDAGRGAIFLDAIVIVEALSAGFSTISHAALPALAGGSAAHLALVATLPFGATEAAALFVVASALSALALTVIGALSAIAAAAVLSALLAAAVGNAGVVRYSGVFVLLGERLDADVGCSAHQDLVARAVRVALSTSHHHYYRQRDDGGWNARLSCREVVFGWG